MKKNLILYLILILITLTLFVANLRVGSSDVGFMEIFRIIRSFDSQSLEGRIILDIRLPRVIEALFLGGALALSGFLLQTFFQNPIAGPYILGISSGAKLFVAFLMVSALSNGFMMKSWMMIVCAFFGSLVATVFVLIMSGRVKSMSVLVVCGIMVGYVCSAVTELLVTFADDYNIVNLHNWSLGTFSSSSLSDAVWFVPITLLGIAFSILLSKDMEAYMYGESYAITLGINVKLLRMLLIMISSILSATVTAFAGPVSFVGIAMPHVARIVFKSDRPLVLIPASFLLGASFCLFCDLLARSLFAPTELSISTVTAVFGAPIVISMMLKAERRRRANA